MTLLKSRLAPQFRDLLEAIHDRVPPFDAVPYSRFETFLPELAPSFGISASELRRQCFEVTNGLTQLAFDSGRMPRDEMMRRRDLHNRAFAAFNRKFTKVLTHEDMQFAVTAKQVRDLYADLQASEALPETMLMRSDRSRFVISSAYRFEGNELGLQIHGDYRKASFTVAELVWDIGPPFHDQDRHNLALPFLDLDHMLVRGEADLRSNFEAYAPQCRTVGAWLVERGAVALTGVDRGPGSRPR